MATQRDKKPLLQKSAVDNSKSPKATDFFRSSPPTSASSISIHDEKPMKQNNNNEKVNYDDSFIRAESFGDETWIMLKIFFPICIAALAEYAPQVIINNVIGHLPNASHAIATVGLARMFSSLTGSVFVMGMCSDLYTTIPQAIGAQRKDLLHFYVQRAFVVSFIIMIPIIIIQLFSDKILGLIGQPKDLLIDTRIYCCMIIPNIYGKIWLYIVQRVAQSLNYNYCVLWSTIFCAVLMYPLNIIFVYTLNLGFMGSAFALDFASIISFIMIAIYLWYKGYGFIFKPMICEKDEIAMFFDKQSMKDYLSLSLPGLVQSTFEWWIQQIGTILSGYIANPEIALSATVIMGLMNGICIMLCWGCYMAITIRVGKYVGAGKEFEAKRSAKAGLLISTLISVVTAGLAALFRHEIPYFFTNDEQIVDLLSNLIIVLCFLQFFMILYYDISAIYRGIGQQKKSAKIVLLTYYLISLPITLILLFVPEIDFINSTLYGTIVIWSSLAFGNFIAGFTLFIYLICKVNWNKVINESKQRIDNTSHLIKNNDNNKRIKQYGSINNNDHSNNNSHK